MPSIASLPLPAAPRRPSMSMAMFGIELARLQRGAVRVLKAEPELSPTTLRVTLPRLRPDLVVAAYLSDGLVYLCERKLNLGPTDAPVGPPTDTWRELPTPHPSVAAAFEDLGEAEDLSTYAAAMLLEQFEKTRPTLDAGAPEAATVRARLDLPTEQPGLEALVLAGTPARVVFHRSAAPGRPEAWSAPLPASASALPKRARWEQVDSLSRSVTGLTPLKELALSRVVDAFDTTRRF